MTGSNVLGRVVGVFAWVCVAVACGPASAKPQDDVKIWNVDEIREGMTGYGVTVLKGTTLERFGVNVIGVLKSHSPGRDLVLVRVSGIGLEKTGVISGMSGSPVYIEDKLVGAIAYTWSFGTEPIAGITPFKDMREYGKPPKRSDSDAKGGIAQSLLLDQPLGFASADASLENQRIAVSAGQSLDGYLVPIQTPVVTAGISPVALEMVFPQLQQAGLVPVQGGAATEQTRKLAEAKIVPGGAMAVGLITGDVSMTAVGTVTAVQNDRVYGFGHPFFSIGNCEFPLLTAYIHGVIPRQTISSKMGSALNEVGMVDTDVSTCVAGWMGKSADMLPVSIRVKTDTVEQNFRCKIVKEKTLLGPLALAALGSCTDMQGQAPLELTAELDAVVKIKGYPPLRWKDRYSGARFSGPRGLMSVFSPVGNLLQILATNQFERPAIESVECSIEIMDRRQSAAIKEARPVNPICEPGEKLEVVVDLELFQPGNKPAPIEQLRFSVPIPEDLKPGKYTATVSDASTDLVLELRNRRHLLAPKNFSQLFGFLKQQLETHNDEAVLRLNVPGLGVALDGNELPNLPSAFVDIFANDPSQTVTPVQSAIVQRQRASRVIEGSSTVTFEVVKHKEFYH